MSGAPRINASAIGQEAARATWALSARDDLIAAARQYHATLSYQQLAESVQERTGIHTSQAMRYWIGDVLFRVAQECARRGEPNLGSLCLSSTGQAGEVYRTAMEEIWGGRVEDPEQHAAHERLACHRHWGAELPPGGGEPAIPAPPARATRPRAADRPAAPRPRAARVKAERSNAATAVAKAAERPVNLCPTCYTALPASGHCDFCD